MVNPLHKSFKIHSTSEFISPIYLSVQQSWASLIAQLVKNLPAMPETWIQSLGWEDPLEKGKAPLF